MENQASPWGSGKKAAISLTYDDGIPNHLDIAMPMLESFGFRGTFYLITIAEYMRERKDDWRKAFERGHEIGNHTARHPGWHIKDAAADAPRLENMGPDDILREVAEAAEWLDQHIGRDPGRSFAYPYAHNGIGPEKDTAPYNAAVRRHCAGSRWGGGSVPNKAGADPFTLRSFGFGEKPTAEKVISFCDEKLKMGGWTILTFHGVGGPWIETAAEVHRELLQYLASQPILVAPVREVIALSNGFAKGSA